MISQSVPFDESFLESLQTSSAREATGMKALPTLRYGNTETVSKFL